jgi:adenosine deaminase
MAGNEGRGKPHDFFDVYDRAYKPVSRGGLGLRTSTHAGEVSDTDDINGALDLPGLSQVSHALSAVQCPSTLMRIRKEGVFVDQLLISNMMLHGADPDTHPIKTFISMGIPVGLGSDDPGLQNTTIADEYVVAARDFGLSRSQLLQITADAVTHAFIEPEVKHRLQERIMGFAREHGIALLMPQSKPLAGGGALALGG